TLADTIVVMADGAVQPIGSPTEVYRRPANRFVAGFIGQSNLLEAQVLDQSHLSLWGRVIDVAPLPVGLRQGDAVTLAIRPEDIRVLPGGSAAANEFPGCVTFAREVGERVQLRSDCGGRE